MSLTPMTCQACGGAVMMQVGQDTPRCLFCDSPQMVPGKTPEEVEPPRTFVPFCLDATQAHEKFRTFARSSFFYPSDIRETQLDLNQVLVPAWAWSGDVETHYAALVHAATRSGKRPVSGAERLHISGALVLASSTLTHDELETIAPFDGTEAQPFDPDQAPHPFELGHLTRSVALQEGTRTLKETHRGAIRKQTAALDLRTSAVCEDLEGFPVLLPVFIGAYRRKDKFYRVVINGQTGTLTGDAPISFWRVLIAILVVAAIIGAVVLLVTK